MLGLEPGDVMLARSVRLIAILVLDEAKADEGVHLVAVAAHRLGEFLHAPDIGIGAVLHDPRSGL